MLIDKVHTLKLALRRKKMDASEDQQDILIQKMKISSRVLLWQLNLCRGDGDRLLLSQSDGVWRCSDAWGIKRKNGSH